MVSRRLYWDDAWATLSLVLLLGLSISLTLAIPTMYEVLNVGAGLELPTLTFMPDASKYLKLQFAMTILFWSCIWSVKGKKVSGTQLRSSHLTKVPQRVSLPFIDD